MKIGQISVYQKSNSYIKSKYCCNLQEGKGDTEQQNVLCKPTPKNISFNGKFGAWVGGILGATAVVAGAIVAAAPAALCLLGAGAVAGAVGGHATEDAVNGKKDDDD